MKIETSFPLLSGSILLATFALPFALAGANNPHDQSTAHPQAALDVDSRLAGMTAPSAQELAGALADADALIARQDLAVYRGWLKYLKFRAVNDPVRMGAESADARESYLRLCDWTAKIAADPDTIHKLRGVQEWAYESQADGTGQPFRIAIPTDYNPDKPAGLSISCHGYSGNHIEHSTGMAAHPGRFDVAVLGRARGGMYRMLSERDVMDVFAYVKATWKIDENRVNIVGGSMGGLASMWLGSRYPDRFAASMPSCGFALRTPVENMLNLPVYALHSKDDPVVYVIDSRGPLKHLKDLGGMVVMEDTDGYGHAVWNWAEGQARAAEWGVQQVRPDPQSVREVRYTATDGTANGAWWAHVAEWGPRQAPARISLKLGPANVLYGTLSNINRLRLGIAQSPIDRSQPLQLSFGGARPITLPAPLPDSVDIVMGSEGVTFEAPLASAVRPHTPGAAAMVYDGSPILIVYGTKGDEAANSAMKAAAIAASKSPNVSWPSDAMQRAPQDGISHYENLYGNLPVKADTEVTEEDIARSNLVLIGTAKDNSLVARIAAKLPVSEAAGSIKTSDGFTYDATSGNAWALVHYNPLATQRLILWIASRDSSFYKPEALLPREMLNHGYGADFVVMSPDARVYAARSFDSNWNWSSDYAKSPLLPDAASTKPGWAHLQADLMREAAGTDFGVAILQYKSDWLYTDSFMAAKGVTRYADLALLGYQMRLYVLDLKGSELAAMRERMASEPESGAAMSSNFASATLNPDATYSVAFDWDAIAGFVTKLGLLPQSVHGDGLYEVEAFGNISRDESSK